MNNMFSLICLVLVICLGIEDGFCTGKRLLMDQNDVESKLMQLESMLASCNATISTLKKEQSKSLERISTLEGKVNNSTQHLVAFTACHSKGSTIGVHQTVLYDHVITNIGNAYDVRDGEFNVPYDGLYTFSITGMAYGNTDMYLTLFKNGVYVQKLYSNSGNADSSSFTTHLYLQAGDEVWVVNGGPTSDQLHPGNYNCFSGILVKEKH